MPHTVKTLTIDVFADVVCPWCYIGEHRLGRALAQRPELAVERRWRPYQLQPQMPAHGMPWEDFVRTKFGGLQRAQPMFDRVTQVGAADGLTFRFDRVASAPNTTDAHRLILFAADRGLEWEMAERLFRAHFAEGRDLNDRAQLIAMATEIGLGSEPVESRLAGPEKVSAVEASQEEAATLGISGVPFFVFDNRFGVSGAQPVETFLKALAMAEAE
jgi:predicted DsbA family dithiol-disulfide isomerase